MRTFFRYTLITLFVGFFIAGAILQTKSVRNSVKEYLIKTIEEQTGYTAEIADVRLFPSFQFNASEVSLYENGKKLAAIQHIHFGLYPLDLWQGYVHLHTLHLEGVQLYTATESNGKTPPSLALKDLPFKVNIDFFNLHDLVIIDADQNPSTPITAKGNIYISPEESLVVMGIRLKPVDDSENWINGEIAYENGEGSIQIDTDEDVAFDAEFIIGNDNLLRIKRFHANYEGNTLDGNATLTYDGFFQDSSIFFSSGNLYERFPVDGTFYGEGKLLGSLWSPELDLTLKSDQLRIQENVYKDIEVRLLSSRTKDGLEGEVTIAFVKDDLPSKFSGKIFWDEALGPLPTRFIAKTNMSDLAQILDIETTDINGDVEIEFLFSDQEIKTKALLRNGRIESYQLGSVITGIEAVFEGDIKHIELKSLTAVDGEKGSYTAKGSMDIDPENNFPFEINITIDKAQLVYLDNAKAIASGKLTLHGNAEKAQLEGRITADSARLTIPEKVSAVTDTVQVTYINQSPEESPPTPYRLKNYDIPLELNITLEVPGDTTIKGRGFTSEWKGEAKITGTPLSPKVYGELTVINGKYRLRGRSVDINKGTITFAGDLEKKTSLYVIGEMDIDRYTIEIIVKGLVKNPNISFRSNPPLSRKEILSWLLFNKDISDISEFQGGKLSQSITNISSGTDDGPDILTRFGDAIGLDRVDITGSPDASQVSFEFGKYVSESTYISISRKPVKGPDFQRVGTGTLDPDEYDQTNRIGIETSLGSNFKVQAEVDEDQFGQINLIWKKDY